MAARVHDGKWRRPRHPSATGGELGRPETRDATRPLYTAKGAKEAALGVIKVESDTRVAVDQRLVSFSDFTIAESNFPHTPADAVKAVVSEITTSVPLDERVIALDRVLANMDTSQIIPKNVEGVKADPPTIFFSQTPVASSSSTSRCGHRFRRTTCDRRSTPTGISSSTRHPLTYFPSQRAGVAEVE